MPTRARLDEFITAVVSGDHAGAIERYYTEDASMQENAAAPPRPFGGARARHAGAGEKRDFDLRVLDPGRRPRRDSLDFRLHLSFR